jgi:serine phosphatase RsbU (regulator of sigma subunit)
MPHPDLASALRSTLARDPASVPTVLAHIGLELGASDLVVYLVDFGQTVLEPLDDHATHTELPHTENVAGTMAGRAFLSQLPVTAERDGGFRAWVPIIEGSDRTGVLAMTLSDVGAETLTACEELGLFAGHLIATHARVSDVFNLHRRRKPMTLAASMQWDLLPPLFFKSARVTVAGFLEPAYEVGGDCFDYAINGSVLEAAVMDAMGHGMNSAIMAGLAIGCYRHDRREARALDVMHADLEATIADHYPANGFVTGQLAQLNVETGSLSWTNAGHPLPLHIRGGNVIGQLACKPTLPWGIGLESVAPVVAAETLEPGDALLFFSDGAVEGRSSTGGGFGLDRLVDLAGQSASDQLPPETIVRNLGQAIVHYHDQNLGDDVTLVMVQWHGPAHSPN